VTGQRQRQVIGGNAAAIVTHPQQLDAALLDIDIDAFGAGVEAVFQQPLITDAGRSTTSPAAIWFASRGLSSSMRQR
jgi:hypothetical protein